MKSFFYICLLLVLCGMAESLIKEYSYVSEKMNWTEAQNYCKLFYTDLAIITTEKENQKAVKVSGQSTDPVWIGLVRTVPHEDNWQWSGGEHPDFMTWQATQPNDWTPGQNCVAMNLNGWNDAFCTTSYAFICYTRFKLVKEKKTWDEALIYCRTNYTDLIFVDSETLLNLLGTETKQAQTASLWTSLRFLDAQWFWVNGMLVRSLVSLPSCPVQPYHCGAYNFNASVWENRDCIEELNFICYY